MRRVAAAALLVLSVTGQRATRAAAADEITPETVRAVRHWVAAVRSHSPGRRDAASHEMSTLTFDRRVELNPGVPLFLRALLGARLVTRSDAERDIVQAARLTRESPGAEIFLKRAAVLHADAALQNELDERRYTDGDSASSDASPNTSPLLTRRNLYIDKDGEINGEVLADWNWPFARSLLDRIAPRPADDPFVATWYHATAAFMLQKGLYGEVVTHLARAAVVVDDDARVLFDRACYSEIQGLPVMQVLLSEQELLTLRATRAGRPSPAGTRSERPAALGIPLPEVTNEEAERLFRRAIRADPDFIEARVRLARLLNERGRHQEATVELSAALAARPTGPVAFYAHLFAGRAAQGLGRIDEAAGHYQEAVALFPRAQSARLALSQAALLGADVPGTLEQIDRLGTLPAVHDPWWQYHLAAGRDADGILRDMWSKATKF